MSCRRISSIIVRFVDTVLLLLLRLLTVIFCWFYDHAVAVFVSTDITETISID